MIIHEQWTEKGVGSTNILWVLQEGWKSKRMKGEMKE